jgi:hypothetical protein
MTAGRAQLRLGGAGPTASTLLTIPVSRHLGWSLPELLSALRAPAFHAAAAVAILLLSACSSNPPIISADTSCERFRHISATPAQIKVYQDNWEVMETYADQIVSHNLEYDRHCLGVAP